MDSGLISWSLIAALVLGVWLFRSLKSLMEVYAYPHLARLGIARERAPRRYVRALFDGYAEEYDAHLLEDLESAVPNLVSEAVHRDLERRPRRFGTLLDLGCGTGTCGVLLRPLAERMVGVDLSPKMLDVAARRETYDALHQADMVDYLSREREAWDLIVASDAVVYLGDLDELIRTVATALAPGGLFVFTTEAVGGSLRDRSADRPGYELQLGGRFAHDPSYVAQLASRRELQVIEQRAAELRLQEGESVAGHVHRLLRPE